MHHESNRHIHQVSVSSSLFLFPQIYCNERQDTYNTHICSVIVYNQQLCKCDSAMINLCGRCVSICLCLSILFVGSSRYKLPCRFNLSYSASEIGSFYLN